MFTLKEVTPLIPEFTVNVSSADVDRPAPNTVPSLFQVMVIEVPAVGDSNFPLTWIVSGEYFLVFSLDCL